MHDRDHAFKGWAITASAMDIEELLTAPRSPWQNAYVERFIGSVRRECLDHVIVFNASGLQRLMRLLRPVTNSPVAEQGHADPAPDRYAGRRSRRSYPASRRPSSPVRAARRLTHPSNLRRQPESLPRKPRLMALRTGSQPRASKYPGRPHQHHRPRFPDLDGPTVLDQVSKRQSNPSREPGASSQMPCR